MASNESKDLDQVSADSEEEYESAAEDVLSSSEGEDDSTHCTAPGLPDTDDSPFTMSDLKEALNTERAEQSGDNGQGDTERQQAKEEGDAESEEDMNAEFDREGNENAELDKEEDEESKALELRRQQEDCMTEEQRQELRDKAQLLKESGNSQFKGQKYVQAADDYSQGLQVCPLCYVKERSVLYSNRAAAHLYLEKYDDVIKDCTQAIDLHPHYAKPLLRRAQTYEKTEKLDEALADFQKVLELEPRNVEAYQACQRLPGMINERNEKLKAEMMGKLKDLGNLVLRPFGLSTDNFQFVQNESGGYSVNFNK